MNAMKNVPVTFGENVLVGFDTGDDAGVFKISDDLALVQSVDFFTPIVDDPFIFGQIAAANSLSDIYAMGGEPVTAMNIVAFPLKKFTLDILSEILRGGLDILNSAGVQLLGGHSIEDNELKYGLSVTGKIHPKKIIKNVGLKDGDALILTKALGTGIIGTAVKAQMIDDDVLTPFIKSMITLNRQAAQIMKQYDISACTDITGFGLAGHLMEMAGNDKIEIAIESRQLPILPGVKDCSETGLIPAGLYRNKEFAAHFCSIDKSVEQYIEDIIFDPQTSGGLLMGITHKKAARLLKELHSSGINDARIIGKISSAEKPGLKII